VEAAVEGGGGDCDEVEGGDNECDDD
ncbi:hypothetical protein Tco_0022055, partial [Tanacetum coccineum]